MEPEVKTETKRLNLSWSSWRRLPRWLVGPTLFRVFVLVILVSSLLGDWTGWLIDANRQDRIRYAGWLLDIFGLVTVAIGVSRKLDLFHGASLWGLFKDGFRSWLRQFPLVSRHITVHLKGNNLNIGLGGLKANLTGKLSPDATLERKVDFLLQRNDELTQQLFEIRDEVAENKKELTAKLAKGQKEVEKTIKEMAARTEDAAVGEIGWEVVGLAWIFLGITFATVPEFIEYLFGWLIRWFNLIGEWLVSVVT